MPVLPKHFVPVRPEIGRDGPTGAMPGKPNIRPPAGRCKYYIYPVRQIVRKHRTWPARTEIRPARPKTQEIAGIENGSLSYIPSQKVIGKTRHLAVHREKTKFLNAASGRRNAARHLYGKFPPTAPGCSRNSHVSRMLLSVQAPANNENVHKPHRSPLYAEPSSLPSCCRAEILPLRYMRDTRTSGRCKTGKR